MRRSVCSIALLLVCLDWKSDSFTYRTHLPFDSKVATLPEPTLVNRLSKLEHTKEPVGEGETWDRTAIYVDGKAVVQA